MTETAFTRRRELARDVLFDAMVALRDARHEEALVLSLIAVMHLQHLGNVDRALELWKAAQKEASAP